tara:strand:+ start:1084 stop:1437 length:354 start_codon:yes stop_codon:yes gene_type:complete
MATLYNKTALKKVKKDDLIQLFLDQQAKLYDALMDETDYKYEAAYLAGRVQPLLERLDACSEENEKLKAENEKLRGELEREIERHKQIIRHQKDIIDDVEQSLQDQNEELNKIVVPN